MVKSLPPRRGRCPHRPGTLRAEPFRINEPLCSRTSRADVGIGPYADIGFLPFIRPRPELSGGPLHTRPGLRPVHPLQAGEGCLRRGKAASGGGRLPPAGKGLPPGRRGQPPGGGGGAAPSPAWYRPTTVTPSACHPLPGEGIFLKIPSSGSGLLPSLPRPAGACGQSPGPRRTPARAGSPAPPGPCR